jgi:phospholipase/carboxylesterase
MLDGPRLPPKNGLPPKSLVVFLHGYGADGRDLIDIGRQWAPLLPSTAFVAPHAPAPCDDAPMGRQWFPIPRTADGDRLREGAVRAAPALNAFLDAELVRNGIPDRGLALVGFSQGTMMALQVAPRRPNPIAGVVGYSGLLAAPDTLAAELRQRPPVMLIHGDQDPMIPVGAMFAAAETLGAAEVPVEWHVRPGLAHGIDQEGLALGGDFLRRVLPG